MISLSGKPVLVACAIALSCVGLMPQDHVRAQSLDATQISLRDTFPIGSNALCEAQILPPEEGAGLFERKYAVLCRDAAAPIGTLWVKRGQLADQAQANFAPSGAVCSPSESQTHDLSGLAQRSLICREDGSVIQRQLLVSESGNRTYAAVGLPVYSKALNLGIETLIADREVPGSVDIPLTQTTDAIAFARQQADAIAADQALVEAYRRSNSGQYAEAAEFFAASAGALTGDASTEARLNEALLQSNLGNFTEADRLFLQTQEASTANPVLARLQRNFQVIDALNRDEPGLALERLDVPVDAVGQVDLLTQELQIDKALANRLAAETTRAAGSDFANSLSVLERAQLLDGQAAYLRASALRLLGNNDLAAIELERANNLLIAVREGRVNSIIWLRAQVLGELASVSELNGVLDQSELLHLEAIALLAQRYPDTPAFQSARAQLAGYYARNGQQTRALDLYRDIVSVADGRSAPALRNLLAPYFALLLEGDRPERAAADMFSASQLLVRPGLAQTQAVLARELSGGSDEAALLFRKTINLGRAIEQVRAEVRELALSSPGDAPADPALAASQQQLASLEEQQATVLQQLAEYPRFRAVTQTQVDLPEFQSILKDGEAYLKLITLEREAFVIFATSATATAYQVDASPQELEAIVDQLRDSIALAEGGQILTFPFDIAAARELYVRLFEPIANQLTRQDHIVFEPDGALLKLPINLLVTDDRSVADYQARLAASPDADEYDFRGTAWLGREAQISTSVSPAAFRDVRASRPSRASKSYLGLGQNLPVTNAPLTRSSTRSATMGGENCDWSPGIWSSPISPRELVVAAEQLGADQSSAIITQADFSDTAIMERDDLGEYRILHFATHGLVTAPKPGCPPRPALLTSFGDAGSDGMLSFAEIFALRIDADLVILSACDTAGGATIGATREAGLTSGGDFALDGLVRALVGAGGRTVLASHWSVPDDFDATERLISGLFQEQQAATAEALRQSQLALMDDPLTSHPYYWSAFAVVGDGAIRISE